MYQALLLPSNSIATHLLFWLLSLSSLNANSLSENPKQANSQMMTHYIVTTAYIEWLRYQHHLTHHMYRFKTFCLRKAYSPIMQSHLRSELYGMVSTYLRVLCSRLCLTSCFLPAVCVIWFWGGVEQYLLCSMPIPKFIALQLLVGLLNMNVESVTQLLTLIIHS